MYKVGQEVKIIANNSYHEFKIGEIVRVRSLDKYGEYTAECLDGSEYWFVDEEDICPVKGEGFKQ